MVDTCRVERPGAATTNPDTGKVTRPSQVIYEGKCQLQLSNAQASTPDAGEHRYTVQDSLWKTPVLEGPFEVGDVVTITKALADPQLVGTEYRVTALFHQSLATSQRCKIEGVTD